MSLKGEYNSSNYPAFQRSEKRKRKLKKIVCIILCIAVLTALVLWVIDYHSNALKEAYTEGERAGHIVGFEKGYAYYKDAKDKYEDEYNFYHHYAVITTATGKKYHKYGCQHIKDKSFYIFNISKAKAQGYTNCLDCSPTLDDIKKEYGVKGTPYK